MGKKANLSGVQAKGSDRIQLDFEFEGVRYRPTLKRIPSEANLRRAYKQLQDIKERIERGLFNFEEEFPNYRYKAELPTQEHKKVKTCDDVFRSFLANCEMRVAMDDMPTPRCTGIARSWSLCGLRRSAHPSSRR